VVEYADAGSSEPLALEGVVVDAPVDSSVTEYAIEIEGCGAEAPTEVTLVQAESGDEIIFWYTPLLA